MKNGFKQAEIPGIKYRIFYRELNEAVIDFEIYEEHPPLLDDDLCLMYGSVKFDGCSNWSTNESVMLHACSRQDLLNIGEALAACWDFASNNITNWFGDK